MTSKRRFLRSEVKPLRRGGRYSGIYSQTFVAKDDSSLEEEREQTNKDLLGEQRASRKVGRCPNPRSVREQSPTRCRGLSRPRKPASVEESADPGRKSAIP